MSILVTRSSMPSFEEYCEEIKDLWESHWLTNMGIKHQLFQKQLEDFLECPHVALYTNGHLALENSIASMNFPNGAEVITTPFTFVSTTHAIVRNSLTPIFCDIKPDDFTIDPEKIETLITERTVAIVPVHVYGNICDIDAIESIAKKHNLKVIYDAAHSFGEKYKGVSTANFGDASVFSFHATKVFNTIEGGAVCFKDDNLISILNDMKNFGIRDAENVVYVGGNAKMSEFQAAMGICNLRHIKTEIEKRKNVAERYRCNLNGVKGIKLCEPKDNAIYNYAYFPVAFDGYDTNRDNILLELKKNDIIARKYFYPLTSDLQCYKHLSSANNNKTPIATYWSDRILTLPMYADLCLEDVDRICKIVIQKNSTF